MVYVCETCDKCVVVQNEKANYELRFRGFSNVDQFAKLIHNMNNLSKYELEALIKVAQLELSIKKESGY